MAIARERDDYWVMWRTDVGIPGGGSSVTLQTREFDGKAQAIDHLISEWSDIINTWCGEDEHAEWECKIAKTLERLRAGEDVTDVRASVADWGLPWGELNVVCEGNWGQFAGLAVSALGELLANSEDNERTEDVDPDLGEQGETPDEPLTWAEEAASLPNRFRRRTRAAEYNDGRTRWTN